MLAEVPAVEQDEVGRWQDELKWGEGAKMRKRQQNWGGNDEIMDKRPPEKRAS